MFSNKLVGITKSFVSITAMDRSGDSFSVTLSVMNLVYGTPMYFHDKVEDE